MKNLHLRGLAMVAAMLIGVGAMAQTTIWRDLHKVKKRETIFGIARDYGITIDQLIDANPEMKTEGYELKKGDWIFVPYGKDGDKKSTDTASQQSATATSQASAAKPAATAGAINVGVMLPLHDVNGDGRRMVEYYRGLLMAVEYMKRQGRSVNVYAWNVPEEADVRTTLLDDNAAKCNLIVGPLYSKMVPYLSNFCKQNGIKLLIPFSITGDDVAQNPQIFQVYQDDSEMNRHAVNAFLERFSKAHPVFVDCNDEASRKGVFTTELRKQLSLAGISYSITNLNSSQEDFAKAFQPGKTNVVVLNSGRSPELNSAFAKLDELKKAQPQTAVAMYGYTEWFMYIDYDLKNFYKYNVYIPTSYYYNPFATRTKEFESRYRQNFHAGMMQALPRFALTGYDQAMYFLSGMAKNGAAFTGAESDYKPIQSRFKFERVGSGGYKNRNFQLIHYLDNQTVEAINY